MTCRYEICLRAIVGTLEDEDCLDIAVRPISPPQVIVPQVVNNQNHLEDVKVEGIVCYPARAVIEWVSVVEAGQYTWYENVRVGLGY